MVISIEDFALQPRFGLLKGPGGFMDHGNPKGLAKISRLFWGII